MSLRFLLDRSISLRSLSGFSIRSFSQVFLSGLSSLLLNTHSSLKDRRSLKYCVLFSVSPNSVTTDHFCVRGDAVAVFHTHSPLSVVASLMTSSPGDKFTASGLQMVKAMRGLKWSDTLELPIIGNKDTEDAIAEDLEIAVRDNPGVDAVLIRGHGLYVWGPSWQAAKVMSPT